MSTCRYSLGRGLSFDYSYLNLKLTITLKLINNYQQPRPINFNSLDLCIIPPDCTPSQPQNHISDMLAACNSKVAVIAYTRSENKHSRLCGNRTHNPADAMASIQFKNLWVQLHQTVPYAATATNSGVGPLE